MSYRVSVDEEGVGGTCGEKEQVKELTTGVELGSAGNMDVVELTRAGCTYLKELRNDEYELFKQLFDAGEDQFYQCLETLCDYLYDNLRPRILHEPRLTALCEVCTALQVLMVEVHDEEDEETQNSPESKLHTSRPSATYPSRCADEAILKSPS
uniref:Putative cis-golgi transport vesicle tethering complex subunit n=1 Tax=Moniliophthora roreri TaxID=221103 RepID=A0A0W0EWH0_MONRR